MVGDLERRAVELRFIEGIEKAEHVPYPKGDEFWVRFNRPLDLAKFNDLAKKHGYVMVRFGTLISKLPRGISEMLWDGVTQVIAKKIGGWSKFTSFLGLEPEGIAKIANDLHGRYQIFMATQEEGVQLIYEYLGQKYTPPTPPPPVTQPKAPAAPTAPKPVPAAPPHTTPPPPVPTKPQPVVSSQPTAAQPGAAQSAPGVPKPTGTEQPKKDTTGQKEG